MRALAHVIEETAGGTPVPRFARLLYSVIFPHSFLGEQWTQAIFGPIV